MKFDNFVKKIIHGKSKPRNDEIKLNEIAEAAETPLIGMDAIKLKSPCAVARFVNLHERPTLKDTNYEGFDLIYGKNINEKIAPASIVKLLTCMVLIDIQDDLDETFEVTDKDKASGSGSNLNPGDIITFRDALYNMLLPSSNVSARAVSRVVGEKILKGREGNPRLLFFRRMNKKAKELGLKNSNFTNASGSYAEKMHSTANDLALLGISALRYPDILKAWSASSYVINVLGRSSRKMEIQSTLKNINDSDILGGKTGTLSGTLKTRNLITLVSMGNDNFIILLTAGATFDRHRYMDTRKIINYMNGHIRWPLRKIN
ncbi:D-alanyl-D-alanine carboxypeptidase family protein [Vreelandella alkaliphila]|uniref:D-alanyl-D-alanine carboxypeptidase family protein n=1 Tax=Vreelandella alkaliphila TaxID=272774 RepID=UPI003FD8A5D4